MPHKVNKRPAEQWRYKQCVAGYYKTKNYFCLQLAPKRRQVI